MTTTRSQFAFELLARLGTEANVGNLCGLVSAMTAENCDAAFNPLATTWVGFGSDTMPEYNEAGVKQYPTLADGIEATAATLTNGDYRPVLIALAGNSPQVIAQAWSASPWGTEAFDALSYTDATAYDHPIGEAPGPAPAPAPAPAPSPAPATPSEPSAPILSIGLTGWAVRALQRLLGITADGIYGPQTQAAVEAFQAAHGLAADGVCGPLTWGALL